MDDDKVMKLAGWALVFAGVVMFIWFLLILIALPISMNAQAKCLEKGYPKYAVTYHFKTYCITLDGSVKVKVDGQ